MIGGIEETSASFEARSAPRSYPTMGLPQGLSAGRGAHLQRSIASVSLLVVAKEENENLLFVG